jgi:hypothetical protein
MPKQKCKSWLITHLSFRGLKVPLTFGVSNSLDVYIKVIVCLDDNVFFAYGVIIFFMIML